jgi:hypothetical protein
MMKRTRRSGPGHAGLDRGAQPASGQEGAEGNAEYLAEHDHGRQNENRRPVPQDEGGVDQHSHRDEKDCREDVTDRFNQMLDLLLFPRLGDQGAGDERPEGDRVTELLGQQRQGKAEADAGHDGRLGPVQAIDQPHRAGNEEEADGDQPDQEGNEPAYRHGQGAGGEAAAGGDGGERRHEQDGDQVLDDQHPDHDFPQLSRDPLLLEGLGHDGCTGDGDDRPREQALHDAPAEQLGDGEAEPHHQARFDHRREGRRGADLDQLAQAEFESEGEHQQDHPDLGESPHDGGVGHQRARHVRPDEQAGEDVAEDDGLAQALKNDGRHRCHAKHYGERSEEFVGVVHDHLISGYGLKGSAAGRRGTHQTPGTIP